MLVPKLQLTCCPPLDAEFFDVLKFSLLLLTWPEASICELRTHGKGMEILSSELQLDIQQLREQNEKLDADLRTARQDLVSQEESKRLQEKIKVRM